MPVLREEPPAAVGLRPNFCLSTFKISIAMIKRDKRTGGRRRLSRAFINML